MITKTVFLVLFICVAASFGQTWISRARVQDHTDYFMAVMQETVLEIEKLGFCNLKLVNITQNVNVQMYKWLVNGTVVYTNGFLVSVQRIDLSLITQTVSNPTIDGVPTPRATVTGTMNFRDPKLGYDVIFTPTEGPVQRYTGDYTHTTITLQFQILKDLTTKEISLSITTGTSAGNPIRMVYRPANNLTEVLSRNFFAYNNADGVASWRTILQPIVLDIVRNRIEFPKICFGNC